jgi:excisionase family DNA binding protein
VQRRAAESSLCIVITDTPAIEERSATASDGLLTKEELAPKLRRSTRTVDSWMKAGRLPYLKIGRSVLFSWPQVIDKLNAHRVN